ncbi:MAG: FKBP-type peptidyl-prolyl cis-trans isomerase [Microthrixaceae bacterium]
MLTSRDPDFLRRVRRAAMAALAVSAVVIAGCGDDATTATSAETTPSPETTAPISETQAMIEERGAPKVTVPEQPATKLEITDLEEGSGDEVQAGATITAHYVGVAQGTGKKFDSSWDRGDPVTFPLGQVIQGWTEGLVGMKVGGRRQLVIPGSQAYGEQPPPESGIEPDETLVFVIDLVRIDDSGPTVDEEALTAAEARGAPTVKVPDPLPEELTSTDEVTGTGDEVTAGAEVTVHYTGVSAGSGEKFDSSWDRREPATFSLDQVIPGWGEGMVGMKVGGRRTLVIPPAQAYGEDPPPGSGIEPGETLVFVIDLVGIG